MTLKALAKAAAKQAAVGALTVGFSYLQREAVRRLMPVQQLHFGGEPDMDLAAFLATKPGAPLAVLPDGRQVLGEGQFLFQHAGHWFTIWRGLARSEVQENSLSDRSVHASLLRALTGGWPAMRQLQADARTFARVGLGDRIQVHRWIGYGWQLTDSVAARPLSSVVLQEGVAERLLEDMRAFLRDSAWYAQHHVPYRRGYLLHGPPGSGKSTLAGALAGACGLGVCTIALSGKGMDDHKFAEALRMMPSGTVLLLEDVDAATTRALARGEGEKGYYDPHSDLTLSGILNALDGLASREGLLVFMTTNHPERLDPALVRPGRVDVRQEIGMTDESQRRRMFLRFFPGQAELADAFAETLTYGDYSPAELQELLVRNRGNAEAAFEEAWAVNFKRMEGEWK